MRDDICTIPVSEIFEINDGCPICRMHDLVEKRIVDYIMGDAMMEPDVRIETNAKGFCEHHFEQMLDHRGRLQMALMLQTHIAEINKNIFEKKFLNTTGKKVANAKKVSDSCFICEKIEWGVSRMIEMIYRCYESEKDFRSMFDGQPMFCLPHYERLIGGVDKKMMKSYGSEFVKSLNSITGDYAKSLYYDITKYCAMYDYRSNKGQDADWGNSKDSVERTVAFLTGNQSYIEN